MPGTEKHLRSRWRFFEFIWGHWSRHAALKHPPTQGHPQHSVQQATGSVIRQGRHDIYPPFACKRLWNWHDNKLLALPDCTEDRLAVTFDRRARPQSHAWETFLWDTSFPINSNFIHIFSKPFQMIDRPRVCTLFWGRKSIIKGAKKSSCVTCILLIMYHMQHANTMNLLLPIFFPFSDLY